MSTTEVQKEGGDTTGQKVDMNVEVDIIPVSDIDRAKKFYQRVGWRLDGDDSPVEGLRVVQFTPPGSGTSVNFGLGINGSAPGSAVGGLTVSDIEAAHGELVGRGIEVSDMWHGPPAPPEARQPGPDPERTSYGSFFSFNDPDGNMWIVQEVTTRRPGAIDPANTTFRSSEALESALRRAEAAHVEHQKRTGRSHLFHRSSQDDSWPAWYASYLVAEQAGTDLPS
jgi:catechol 2,3-dioxygenase-like lactoylglutathione lyase family enzyme